MAGGAGQQDPNAALAKILTKGLSDAANLRYCVLTLELIRVRLPCTGPDDEARWGGVQMLVRERFAAESFLEREEPAKALVRFRTLVSWGEKLEAMGKGSEIVTSELLAARAGAAWALAVQAAPILDAGNVTSQLLKAAEADLDEAERLCEMVEANQKGGQLVACLATRAKLRVAREDDFEGAYKLLMEAQAKDPTEKRVQVELKVVREALAKERESKAKAQLLELRERLQAALPTGDEEAILKILKELEARAEEVSWDMLMETKIGKELGTCRDRWGKDTKVHALGSELLTRFKDASKEQRPLWER